MQSLGPALHVFSHVLMAFALAFAVPMGWAWVHDDVTHEVQWAQAAGLTLASGLALWLATRRHKRELATRDGFLLVNLVWLVLPAYAALPLKWMVPDITWHHAYFEAMSALTATGATALSGLERLPVSINIWRCFL